MYMASLTVAEKRLETKNSFIRSLKYGISCMVYIVIKVFQVLIKLNLVDKSALNVQ
jgi:hypothetical protein